MKNTGSGEKNANYRNYIYKWKKEKNREIKKKDDCSQKLESKVSFA